MTSTRDIDSELLDQFGLDGLTLHYGLTQNELFEAAVANDRGRVRHGGPDGEPKAYATALGDVFCGWDPVFAEPY